MKKLTIIHSNDLHGDFLPEENGNVMTGGVARLSGYINKVRSEEENGVFKNGKPKIIATSTRTILDEYLSVHQNLDRKVSGRLVILN